MSLRDERLAKGQCPRCGQDAAPYYLCSKCRGVDAVGRFMNRYEKAGAVSSLIMAGKKYYKLADATKWDSIKYYPILIDLKDGDKRKRPRFRGVPVAIENTIYAALESIGRPATVEEIQSAWATLKTANRLGTIQSNLVQIIEGRDRRAAKLARRAERANREHSA